jgi:hypothetical protein
VIPLVLTIGRVRPAPGTKVETAAVD